MNGECPWEGGGLGLLRGFVGGHGRGGRGEDRPLQVVCYRAGDETEESLMEEKMERDCPPDSQAVC